MSSTAESAPGEPARRGRGRPRDPETDKRIINAAAELMLQRGFDKMTVDDVAAHAGVGKATVYRRWPSKDDLAVAAMEQLYAAEIPEPDTGSVRTDLLSTYRAALVFVNSPSGAAYLRTGIAEAIRDDRIAALYAEATARREVQARSTLEKAVERGEVRPDADIDAAIAWFGGMLTQRAITNRSMPHPDEAERFVDFVLKGILA